MNTMMTISIIFSSVALILSLLTCVFAILAYSEVVGMKKSTHRIEWKPVDPDMKVGDEFAKEVSEQLLGKKYVTEDDIQQY